MSVKVSVLQLIGVGLMFIGMSFYIVMGILTYYRIVAIANEGEEDKEPPKNPVFRWVDKILTIRRIVKSLAEVKENKPMADVLNTIKKTIQTGIVVIVSGMVLFIVGIFV